MDTDNLYCDFADDIANCEFQKLFFSKYKNSRLEFYCGSFQDCLREVSNTRKPLIFYLHIENEPFCDSFCKLISESHIEDQISNNFHIIGWNLSENSTLTDKIIIIDEVVPYIEKKKPSIFFIVPNGTLVKVQKHIEKDVSESALLDALLDIQKFLSTFVTEEYFRNMTSAKYQQWMFEEFSDRDYDSFEPDQHESLKDKILYALNGPPKEINDKFGYKEKEIQKAESIFNQILERNNEYSKWNNRVVLRIIYNCTEPLEQEKQRKAEKNANYKSEEDFCPIPLFVLRKCKGENIKNPCRRYIDHDCRVYESWNEYLEKNTIPPGKMIFPVDGRYQSEPNKGYCVWLDDKFSPKCGPISRVLHATDISSTVVGVASGVACVASMFTPFAILTIPGVIGGAVAGSYGVGRSVGTLVDRSSHKQSINVTNPESRAAYFNIVAGAVSAIGAGATKVMTEFARNGRNIGTGVQYTVNAINGTNILVSGTATVYSVYDIVQQYREDGEKPSALAMVQLGSSMFFFGNSIYNFRTASSIINEVQTNTLTKLYESLRSNRQRKTYNKLLKETIRTQGTPGGRAEVISALRDANTRENIIAALTRSNKRFNQNNVKFSAGDGGIKLNGVKVDIIDFGNLPKTQQGVYMESLPPIPENHNLANINTTKNVINNMQFRNDLSPIFGAMSALNPTKLIETLDSFTLDTQQKIIKICQNFMNQLDIAFVLGLKGLLTGDIRNQMIIYVINFIKRHAMNMLNIFKDRLLRENDVMDVCRQFGYSDPHVTINNFIDDVINKCLNGTMMEDLINEFHTWYASLAGAKELEHERKENRHKNPKKPKNKKDCSICGGYYYTM